MHLKRTTLILGAGASQPYGFPLGADLKAKVLSMAMTQTVVKVLVERAGFPEKLIQEFIEIFRANTSGTIDEFLERKSKYRDLGAHLIAHSMCSDEQSARHFQQYGWYSELYRQLNLDSAEPDVCELSIVTFNYERSLEWYLNEVIRVECRDVHETVAHEKRNRIKVIHPHGSLGKYPEVPYPLESRDVNGLLEAAKRIRIVSDKLDASPEFQEAKATVAAADRIIFLGFGFHERTFTTLLENTDVKGKEVFCCCFRLDPEKFPMIRNRIHNPSFGDPNTETADRYLRSVGLVPGVTPA